MSEKPRKHKKRLDSPEPTAIIRELMAQPGIKKIRVFKNGDPYHPGVQMIINDRQVQDLGIFLTAVTRRIDLPYGAKKLYTTNGTHIKELRAIKDGKDYVASSGLFTPLAYGGVKPRRSKSVDPERKKLKKKKKKRAASVAPAKHVELHQESESSKEIEILPAVPKKKVKKIKKKKEVKEEEHHLAETRPVSRHEDHKEDEKHEHSEEEKGKHREDPARSVSRYAHRVPTRAESRMHWKDTSVDDDGEKTEEEHEEHFTDYDTDAESEREGILPSEIHIPFNDSLHEGVKNLELDDSKSAIGHKVQETSRSTRDKVVKEAKDTKESVNGALDKKRKSVYQWGDLSSFTKNIESLLKRKE